MANYLTYADIYGALEDYLKQFKGSKRDVLKLAINQVYLNEVLVCDDLYPLFWLVDFDDTLYAVDVSSISGLTQADPGVVTTSAAHGLTAGDIVGIFNVAGMTEVNNRLFRVGTVADSTHFQIKTLDDANVDTSGFTAYTSGGTVHHFGLTLSTNIAELLRVSLHDEEDLIPITPEEIEKQELITDSTATPSRYYHRKAFDGTGTETDQIIWFLAPNDDFDVRIWKVKQADRLSADADVPLLPHKFHDTIITGVMARLAETENVTVENQIIWPGLYSAQLSAIREYNRRYWEQFSEEKIFGKGPYLL